MTMKLFSKYIVIILLFSFNLVNGQSLSFRGQASSWLTGNPEQSFISQAGIRYIPEMFIEKPLSDYVYADAEFSLNSYLSANVNDFKTHNESAKIKPYRLWFRISSNQFEARAGLQKINFGSATLFRPLMWFDKIDPRDPLKLTDGVYGLLTRYYFQDNTNIWLWGLYDNKDLKGWETNPTKNNSVEFGGRIQTPLFTGEAGLTYHHRNADLAKNPSLLSLSNKRYFDENRFAFDGKWNVEIGVWFEGSIVTRDVDIDFMKYQRQWTLGADYTLDVGNGLKVLTEYFSSENSEKLFNSGKGIDYLGFSADYPIGLLDNVSAIYYRDLTSKENYFTVNWQRTYDNWIVYFLGFFNPKTVNLNQTQAGNNAMAGNGFQIMVVFNH
ncbi:MAG: hypothetical protein JEY94_05760 [Melioribacteraceae bacterium]|nr:hypothetical protein [Melioribacteraceae bacterium]